jgi:hypothetical protein
MVGEIGLQLGELLDLAALDSICRCNAPCML